MQSTGTITPKQHRHTIFTGDDFHNGVDFLLGTVIARRHKSFNILAWHFDGRTRSVAVMIPSFPSDWILFCWSIQNRSPDRSTQNKADDWLIAPLSASIQVLNGSYFWAQSIAFDLLISKLKSFFLSVFALEQITTRVGPSYQSLLPGKIVTCRIWQNRFT